LLFDFADKLPLSRDQSRVKLQQSIFPGHQAPPFTEAGCGEVVRRPFFPSITSRCRDSTIRSEPLLWNPFMTSTQI
jgi:hypothetical protein